MPNHITNIIKASPAVIAALRGEKEIVDFNALISMPPELATAVAEGTATGLAELLTGKVHLRPKPGDLLANLRLSNVLRDLTERGGIDAFQTDEQFENFIVLLRNHRKHRALTWYDWALEHWGTKWNAYDVEAIDGGVQFDTAWSAPHPVIKVLVDRFPDEKIDHKWADEDIGSNLGHRIYHFGAVTEPPIDDPLDFALTVKAYDREGYEMNPVTGKWQYREEGGE